MAKLSGALALSILALPLAGTPSPGGLLGVRLNADLARAQLGDIWTLQVSPDGEWFLYLASGVVASRYELYAGPTDLSSTPIRLSAPLVSGERVLRARFAPDSARIVYEVTNVNTIVGFELLSVPPDGSQPAVTISPTGVTQIRDWEITRDSTRVVLDGTGGIHAVAIDGLGTPTVLSGPPSMGVSFQEKRFVVSPDSSFVVYRAPELSNTVELYRVAITGGPRTRLGHALVSPFGVWDVTLSPDSSRVVYACDAFTNDVVELFSAPADGTGSPVHLNGPFVAGGDIVDFQVDPTSKYVVFSADAVVDGREELFTVPISGGIAVQLTSFAPGADLIDEVAVAPGGTHVLFVADMEAHFELELYTAPIDGSAPPVKINEPIGPSEDVLKPIRFSPDGGTVAYRMTRAAAHGWNLELAPIDASRPPVNIDTAPWDPQDQFEFLPDGSRIAFHALQGGSFFDEAMYTIRTDGTDWVRLNSVSEGFTGGPTTFALMPDSSSIFYISAPYVAGEQYVFRAPVDASSPEVVASAPQPYGAIAGEVYNFRVSPDSQWTVYQADQDALETFELYSAPSDASGPPAKLNAALPGGGDVFFDFLPTGDSTRVVYRADQDEHGVVELYSTAIDGSGIPTKLSPPMAANGGVERIALTPDGSTVVYRADQDVDGRVELYSVPADGSGAAVRINSALVASGLVQDHVFTPAADEVVYRASQDVAGQFELYVAAVDGSGPGTKISGSMVAGGDVEAYVCSPGGRTVFLADADTFALRELYSVPTDGSQPRVRLNDSLPAFADILDFRVAEDLGLVVYYCDTLVDQQGDLFSVPIDGSGPPVHLNSPLAANTDVAEFEVTPDGTRVVYRADANIDGVFELFSVPTDGSAAPVRLHPALLGGQDVVGFEGPPFAITSNSQRVVFRGDLLQDGHFELFRAPVNGSTPSVRLSSEGVTSTRDVNNFTLFANNCVLYEANIDSTLEVSLWLVRSTGLGGTLRVVPNLPIFADVRPNVYATPNYVITPDGSQVLYVADQLVEEVFELFTSEVDIARPGRQASPAPGPVLGAGGSGGASREAAVHTEQQRRVAGTRQRRSGSPVAPEEPEPCMAETFWRVPGADETAEREPR